MVSARVWQLVRRPNGLPVPEDFKLVTETLGDPKDGEILVAADFLSVDPYMRYRARMEPLGQCFIGGQVGTVKASCDPKFPEGCKVFGYMGWRTHTIVNPSTEEGPGGIIKLPNLGSLSPSLALGVLGMPGNTAYFGLTGICQPKKGEVVVVSGAAGAVGSVVGQIAKILGCTVIGYAGSDAKVDWLKALGFDHAFNYKTSSVKETLQKVAPDGVDCHFDNVGGEMSAVITAQMKELGRIAACGAIATYNATAPAGESGPWASMHVISKQLHIEGFIITRSKWTPKWMEGIKQLTQWVKEGKIKPEETVTEGFDKMPNAFIGLFHGENTGKAVVKV